MLKANPNVTTVIALALVAGAIFAANTNFVPDYLFSGSKLTGWHPLGAAEWRAENGEIIGVPT